jgi:hypothetical protein
LKACLVFLHRTLSPNKIYLYDAEMSGLVKTPRVVVRDDAVPDAKTYKSRLHHIYNDPEVKDHLNRRARAAARPSARRLFLAGLRLTRDGTEMGKRR